MEKAVVEQAMSLLQSIADQLRVDEAIDKEVRELVAKTIETATFDPNPSSKHTVFLHVKPQTIYGVALTNSKEVYHASLFHRDCFTDLVPPSVAHMSIQGLHNRHNAPLVIGLLAHSPIGPTVLNRADRLDDTESRKVTAVDPSRSIEDLREYHDSCMEAHQRTLKLLGFDSPSQAPEMP